MEGVAWSGFGDFLALAAETYPDIEVELSSCLPDTLVVKGGGELEDSGTQTGSLENK